MWTNWSVRCRNSERSNAMTATVFADARNSKDFPQAARSTRAGGGMSFETPPEWSGSPSGRVDDGHEGTWRRPAVAGDLGPRHAVTACHVGTGFESPSVVLYLDQHDEAFTVAAGDEGVQGGAGDSAHAVVLPVGPPAGPGAKCVHHASGDGIGLAPLHVCVRRPQQ